MATRLLPTSYRPPPFTGNNLTVDAVFGNDTQAAKNCYVWPFKTIQAALNCAQAGDNVQVRPGTYNESLVIPDSVSLTGEATQSVIIQKLNVTQNTTLITMGSSCRAENFTANLSSSGNYDLIGVDFPTGTSITGKLRNSVWTITSTATGSPTIIGVRSAGTSTTSYSSPNAIQRTTLNVISSSQGNSRGILVSGANRFAVRDIVIYARGTGANIIGAEVSNASGVLEIKTSTVAGTSTGVGATAHDVNRSAGTLYIGATDLLNNDPNGNSFTPAQAPSAFQYGIINNIAADTRYYLVPGTLPANSLISESTGTSYSPANGFPIPLIQPSCVISMAITFTQTLTSGQSVTLKLYQNAETTPVLTLTLASGQGTIKYDMNTSHNFATGDVLIATMETVGNPTGTGAFSALVSYY